VIFLFVVHPSHPIFAAAMLLKKSLGGVCHHETFHTPTLLLLEGFLGKCDVCQHLLHIGGGEVVSWSEIQPIHWIFKHLDESGRQPMAGNGDCAD